MHNSITIAWRKTTTSILPLSIISQIFLINKTTFITDLSDIDYIYAFSFVNQIQTNGPKEQIYECIYVTELVLDTTTSMPKFVLCLFWWIRVRYLDMELGLYLSCSPNDSKSDESKCFLFRCLIILIVCVWVGPVMNNSAQWI